MQEKIFDAVVEQITKRGLILKKGAIVDSAFIEAPPLTKNQKKERDSEAHSSKKGYIWNFGYKAHIGVDETTELVHHIKTIAANEHDITAVPDLIHGEEERLSGDSGCIGAEKRLEAIKKIKKERKSNMSFVAGLHQFASCPIAAGIPPRKGNTKNHLFIVKCNTFLQ